MLKLNEENNEYFKLFIWLLMPFQAGYINVGGFIIFGNFVSHVTGTSSQIGIGIASLDPFQIITFVGLLIAFIIGSAYAGHFLGRRIEENKKPNFLLVTATKALIFFMVVVLSEIYFPQMDEMKKITLVFLLSLACGMQNATCSIATNGFLKPTHMTGLSTDIGISLTKIFGLKDKKAFAEEKRKNLLRIKILFSFISGGLIASIIFSENAHHGFLFPFLSSICMLAFTAVSEFKPQQKYFLKLSSFLIVSVFATTFITGILTTIHFE